MPFPQPIPNSLQTMSIILQEQMRSQASELDKAVIQIQDQWASDHKTHSHVN